MRNTRQGRTVGCAAAAWALLAVVAGARAGEGKALDVPLVVRETAGIARRSAPVSGGVPLPQAAEITRTDQLRLMAADGVTPVDCQFTVLSRWFGTPADETKAIRWARLDFTADVPVNGTARFFLRRAAAAARVTSPLDIVDSADYLIVRTGAMTAHISRKRLTLFEEVFIDADGDGRVAERIVRPDPANGIVIARRGGSRYLSTMAAPPTIRVEQSGPMMAVVTLKGTLKPGTQNDVYFGQLEDLDYVIRLRFYRNRSFVRAHVLVGYPDKARIDGVTGRGERVCHEFKELVLRSTVGLTDGARYMIGTDGRSLTGTLAVGETATVYQDSSGGPTWGPAPGWPTRFRGFEVKTGQNAGLGRGLRAPGWADLSGTAGAGGPVGLTVAVRRFWQEFPKAITLSSVGEVSVGLFPGQWQDLFRLDGGRRKSHDVLFYFHRGGPDVARSRDVAADFLTPLRVVASPEWYADAGGVEPYAVEDDELFGPYERLVRTIVATDDGLGTRAHEREMNDNYGWLHYGDTFLGGSKTRRTWSNNPLDLAYALLIQSLRRRVLAEAFFDEGAAMVRHQVDIDTYATVLDRPWRCWGTRGPDTHATAGSPVSTDHNGLPSLDHTSIDGVVLYYCLTGEAWAREAALKWRDWVAANAGDIPGRLDRDRFPRVRALGPIIDGLCAVYRLTGEEADLLLAKQCVHEMVLKRLSADGYLLSPELKVGDRDAVSPPAVAEVAAAVGRYVHLQRQRRDPDVEAERGFSRMLVFLAQRAWTRTPVRVGRRQVPAALATVWFPDDQTAQYDRVAAQTAIDAFALGYLLWGADRPTYLGLVREMVEAAFVPPPFAVYYRREQPAAARDMARLIRYGQRGMHLMQGTVPRISWVPVAPNLTKRSRGPYLVRVRLRNVPARVVPQLDYALDNTVYTGWRDMRPLAGQVGVWELEIPDLGWRRLAAHRLMFRVRLLRPDRTALGRPRYGLELIDSLDLPPLIVPAIGDVEITAGREATVELRRHARDNEDPIERLTWEVADVDETLLRAAIDAERAWLILRPRRSAGNDTITIVVRDTAGNVARQSVRVTVVPEAEQR